MVKDVGLTGEQLYLFGDWENSYGLPSCEVIIDFDGAKVAKAEGKQEKKDALSNTVENAIKNIMAEKLCKNVDFSDLSSPTANVVLTSLRDFRSTFPNLPLLDFVEGYNGTAKKILRGRRRTVHSVSMRFTRYRTESGHVYNMIFINPRYYGEGSSTEVYPDDGFHPPLCTTAKSDFEHELGHMLDYSLDVQSDKKIRVLYRNLRKTKSITSKLSEYANKNTREFIAEAWSEYCNNPTPREIACTVSSRIFELYAQKYK